MPQVHNDTCPSLHMGLIQPFHTSTLKYEEATATLKDVVWSEMQNHSIAEVLEEWLSTLGKLTAKNYRSGMRRLVDHNLLNLGMSLQAFALLNHDGIVDKIKANESWEECTRQARAACYISFTGFLSRRYQGMIKKAIPSKDGTSKTFFRVHDKVATNAMTQAQWLSFLAAISNARDCLIAKIALQGGKRINEVLSLTTSQIAWDKNEITFVQSKTKGKYKETVITYPNSVMTSLKEYLGEREGVIFVTRTGKSVPLVQLAKSFEKAGIKAKITFKVTPHVLRASTVTFLKQQGFGDSDIMKITGHCSAEMVSAYDKSSRADNASKKVSLVA